MKISTQKDFFFNIIGAHLSGFECKLEYPCMGKTCKSTFPNESTLRKRQMRNKADSVLAKTLCTAIQCGTSVPPMSSEIKNPKRQHLVFHIAIKGECVQ